MFKGARNQAKQQGEKFYFTGKPCINGHIAERYTGKGTCCECMKITFESAKEKKLQQMKSNYYAKKDEYASRMIEWRFKNKYKQAKYSSQKRSSLLLRTPKWLSEEDKKKIDTFFYLAKEKEKETGIKHHVDHIVPLRGKTVSGLNVPWNLQILEKQKNLQKGNKFYG